MTTVHAHYGHSHDTPSHLQLQLQLPPPELTSFESPSKRSRAEFEMDSAEEAVAEAGTEAVAEDGIEAIAEEGTEAGAEAPLAVAPNNWICTMGARALLSILDDPANLLFDSHCGEIQRNLDAEHLAELKQFQRAYRAAHGYYFFPNPIFLAQYGGRYAVLDGQHRLESVRYLLSEADAAAGGAACAGVDAGLVLPVSVVQLRSIEEYDDLFVALNKSKPVRLYRHVRDWKAVLKRLQTYFAQTYPAYLRKTQRPRVPHLNLEALLAHMDEHNSVARIGLDYDALVGEIDALNHCYRLHWRTLIQEKRLVPNIESHVAACVAKCPKRPLFLGIYRSFEWLHRLELRAREGVPYMTMNHVLATHRPKLPRRLKKQVWRKRNGEALAGHCYVCADPLEFDTFECGHVCAVVRGGRAVLENLEPICRTCNGDMGTDDLEEYRARWGAAAAGHGASTTASNA